MRPGSHILYAFANLKPDSGEVVLSDIWADQDIHYPGDSWNDQGKNLYGNFKAIYNLKKQSRHLKVMLSIGGWTYSSSFPPIATHPGRRAKFVQSTIELLEDYGLDGYMFRLILLHLIYLHDFWIVLILTGNIRKMTRRLRRMWHSSRK